MLSQTKSGFIVESLNDGKRFPVFAHERISSLEEISIFTTVEDDLPLREVFRKINEKTEGKPGPDPNGGGDTLKKFFQEVVPEYDPERVYVSDMKKAITWFNLLLEKELLDFTPEEEPKEEETGKEEEKPGESEKTEENS